MSPKARLKINASKSKGKNTISKGKKHYAPSASLKSKHKFYRTGQFRHKSYQQLGPKGGGDGQTPPIDPRHSENGPKGDGDGQTPPIKYRHSKSSTE